MIKNNKINILFVDDDDDILHGISRMLYSMKMLFNIYFAKSSEEAITLVSKYSIDIIYSDIRMPVNSGLELLEYIKNNHPNIIRIILSAYIEDDIIVKASSVAHQLISKPTTRQTILKKSIELHHARSKIENHNLINLINFVNDFPIMPKIYLSIEQEIIKENTSIEKILLLVYNEPMLVAKILKIVNSGLYRSSVKMSKLEEAIRLIGFNTLKELVLYAEIYCNNNSDYNSTNKIKDIANHCLNVAELSKDICNELKLSDKLSDDAFLAAILHDIGKLIFIKYYKEINSSNSLFFQESKTNDIEKLQLDHCNAGGYLLFLWGIPESIVQSVTNHHFPQNSNNYNVSPLLIVYIANKIVNASNLILKEISEIHESNSDELYQIISEKLSFDDGYLNKINFKIDYLKIINKYLRKYEL